MTTWILAIDFGTSYTVAAARIGDRPPEIVEIAGERRVPSVVMVDPTGAVFVGRTAEDLSVAHPGSTLRALKNRLGDQVPAILGGRPFQVVTLVAALLREVYEQVGLQMGDPPTAVHLTHPATWNRPRINKLLEAAAKAGLPHPLLVPEPVAAALSFAGDVGLAPGAPIAVYDLGGGTFDTAVITARDDGFAVVGRPGGDQHIGGELFDELVVNHIGEMLEPDTWNAIQVGDDPLWRQVGAALRHEARKAKEALSSHPYADLLVPLPTGLRQLRLSREDFDATVRPYIDETVATLERCVEQAGVRPEGLAGISLVGGSSRSPIVAEMVQQAFPHVPISRRGDPKATVAAGATLAERPTSTAPDVWPGPITQQASAGTAREEVRLSPPPHPAMPAASPVVAPPTLLVASAEGSPPAPPDRSAKHSRKPLLLVAAALTAAAALVTGIILAIRPGSDDAASRPAVADAGGSAAAATVPAAVVDAVVETTVPSTIGDPLVVETAAPATVAAEATVATSGTELPAGRTTGAIDLGYGVTFPVPLGWSATGGTGTAVELSNGTNSVTLLVQSRGLMENPLDIIEEQLANGKPFDVVSYGPTTSGGRFTGKPVVDMYVTPYVTYDLASRRSEYGAIWVFVRADGLWLFADLSGPSDVPDRFPRQTVLLLRRTFQNAALIGRVVDLTTRAPFRIDTDTPLVVIDGLVGFVPAPGFSVVSASNNQGLVSNSTENFQVDKVTAQQDLSGTVAAAKAIVAKDHRSVSYTEPVIDEPNQWGVVHAKVTLSTTSTSEDPAVGLIDIYYDGASQNGYVVSRTWPSSAGDNEPFSAECAFMLSSLTQSFSTIG